MHLLDHANAAAGGQYTHGDPKTSPITLPSAHTPDSLNAFQEELITPLEDVGQVLDKTNKTQLSKVLALQGYATQRPRTGTDRFAVATDMNDLIYVKLTGITSRWVAVGDTANIWHSEGGDGVADWAQSTVAGSDNLNAVAFGAGVVVAVGAAGKILSSADGGITWTDRTGVTANALNRVVFAAGTFVACGASGTIIQSTDGITWNIRTSGLSGDIFALAYNGTKFLALPTSQALNATSTDGITWATAAISSLTYLDLAGSTRTGKWVTTTGTVLGGSTDDFTSGIGSEQTSTDPIQSVRYIPELDAFVTAGREASAEANTFYIGFGDTTWARVFDVDITNLWNASAWGPGYFLAMAETGVWSRSYATMFKAFG